MIQGIQIEIMVLIPLLLQMIGLTFAILIDPYIRRDHRRIMLIIVALIFSLIAQNYFGYLLDKDGTMLFRRTLVGIYGYSIRPIILLLFFYIVGSKQRYWPFWILIALNAAIHLTAVFSGICFRIEPDNHFHRGPLGYSCHVVSGILLAYLVYLTIREYSRVHKSETWIPACNALLIIASVVQDSVVDYRIYPVSFLTIAVVNSNLFYYIWLHLQFVRKHERAMMAEQRIQIMLSQIKPHFLYNSLGAIEELCDSDPRMAKKATVKFSQYLRGNMDSISAEGTIPFKKELAHTKLYLELEQFRFEDALQVRYDITCTAFSIPTLTLEPLVENAVRHGVRGKETGMGVVTVSTRERPDCYEISVSDDGPGFDPASVPSDGMSHIGIRNVRDRLRRVCGGTLEIESAIGEGTTATIRLPKRQEG